MRLISFQTRKGQSVIVNSNQVQCISSVGTDSKIEFGPGHSILVTTGVEAVKTMLTDEEGLQTIPEATRS